MESTTEQVDYPEPKLQIVEEVAEANAGTVFTAGRKALMVALVIPYLALFFLGWFLIFEAVANLVFHDSIVIRLSRDEAVALLIAGSVALMLGTYMCCYNQQMVQRWIYHYAIRRAIAKRDHAVVAHDDPEAIYVKWTPREQWHEVMLDDAKDVGLLRIDRTTKTLLFEGDRYRHRVPGDLVVACRTEFGGNFMEPFTLVILELPAAYTDVPEICYEYKQTRGVLGRWTGKRRARLLKRWIDEIL